MRWVVDMTPNIVHTTFDTQMTVKTCMPLNYISVEKKYLLD